MKKQIIKAGWRAFRTFGQTFFGSFTASSIPIVPNMTLARTVAIAATTAGIAAGAAFFMNLKE